MNRKYKNLSLNIILFAICSFGHKFLAFLLVPIYTSFLTTAEYGIIDLTTTTINLLIPIFTLNISEAVMRFTMDDKENSKYLNYGVKICLIGAAAILFGLGILFFSSFFSDYKSYYVWIFIIYLLNSFYNLETNYLRAVDKISIMVQGSLINSAVMLSLNCLLIAVFRCGINGYYTAMALGLGTASLYMLVCGKLYYCGPYTEKLTKMMKKACLAYSMPTIFASIAWWINSGLDRYFVTAICGIDQNGIYSMAYKIPTILGVFQTIFNQAWILSAIQEFDKNDSDGFFGMTYKLYNSIMVLLTSGIILFNLFLSRILYVKNFFAAWHYVPMLLIATLFSALAGYLGGAFTAVKDTKTIAYTVIVSAVVNILLNALLITRFGVQGAAVATAVAYFVSWALRMLLVKKYIKMKINIYRDMIVYVLLIIQLFFSLMESHVYIGQITIASIILVLYIKEYMQIFKIFCKNIR